MSAFENSSKSLRVLFVDDEIEILKALERQISIVEDVEGFYISNPLEVANFLNKERIDVIVADIVMPNIDGISLLSEVKNAHPEIIRILLTAHGDYQTSMRALNEAEVFGFITKPWERNYLFGHFEMARKNLSSKYAEEFRKHLPVFAIAGWDENDEIQELFYTGKNKEQISEFCERIFLTSVGLFGSKHRFDDNLFTLPLKGVDIVVRGYLTTIEFDGKQNNIGIFGFFMEIHSNARDAIDTLIKDTETKIRARCRMMSGGETTFQSIIRLLGSEITENFNAITKDL